jgi:hypothetical protein
VPRLEALSDKQRREAAGLLAELLLDAARRRQGVPSGGGFDGVMVRAFDGVAPLPREPAKRGKAA